MNSRSHKTFRHRSIVIALAVIWFCLCWRMIGQAATLAPAPLPQQIDFAKQVVPILQTSCISCHANGLSKGGFRLDTRELMLKGGDSGEPAVIPGHGSDSPLIQLVSETDTTVVMPKKGAHLTPPQITILKSWIDQGAVWPAGVLPGHFKEALSHRGGPPCRPPHLARV